MKNSISSALAILTLASLLMTVQASALPGDNTRAITKGVNIAGKVSADAKTFLANDDNTWAVSNPDALKGQEGRYVTLKCRMDLNQRAIRILYVQEEQAEMKHAASDSAFRR